MKILLINGSPKEKGKTFLTLSVLEKKLREEKNEIKMISLASQTVRGCKGCFACHGSSESLTCVQKDDNGLALMQLIVSSQVIIYGSPVYGMDISSQLKALIDRHNMLYKWTRSGTKSLLIGKKVGLLLTAGGPGGDAISYSQNIFSRLFSDIFGADVIGTYAAIKSSAPDYLDRVEVVANQIAENLRSI
jgi:multimeric flavodoxin WrbA